MPIYQTNDYTRLQIKEKNCIDKSKPKLNKTVIFWPSTRPKNAIPSWCTGRRWHILMAVMRGNRVGGNWLMKWDELKNSHGTLIEWCTGREWPVNCMTVISAWSRLNIRFQRSSGRRTIIWQLSSTSQWVGVPGQLETRCGRESHARPRGSLGNPDGVWKPEKLLIRCSRSPSRVSP